MLRVYRRLRAAMSFAWADITLPMSTNHQLNTGTTQICHKSFLIVQSWLQQMSDKSLPHPFTEKEISTALQKTKPATAPGYDNIHAEFLKKQGPKGRTWLSKFFSRITATHSIPKIW